MPGGDGTGPWWAHGRWSCWNRGRGFGRGYGRGLGRGYGAGYRAVPQGASYQPVPQVSREEELNDLKAYADGLKAELEEIKKKIAALGKVIK